MNVPTYNFLLFCEVAVTFELWNNCNTHISAYLSSAPEICRKIFRKKSILKSFLAVQWWTLKMLVNGPWVKEFVSLCVSENASSFSFLSLESENREPAPSLSFTSAGIYQLAVAVCAGGFSNPCRIITGLPRHTAPREAVIGLQVEGDGGGSLLGIDLISGGGDEPFLLLLWDCLRSPLDQTSEEFFQV